MARGRARRRGFFRRIKPDMGWYVVTVTTQAEAPTPIDDYTLPAAIFTFNDIDSDPPTVSKDKSDWFVRRVLVDGFMDWVGQSANTRQAAFAQFACCTADEREAINIEQANVAPISTTVYESVARVLHTEARLVYRSLPYVHDISPVQDALVVTTAGSADRFGWKDQPRGNEFHYDLKTNFSLRESQAFYWLSGWDAGLGIYPWAADDTLSTASVWRFLLQKRRT